MKTSALLLLLAALVLMPLVAVADTETFDTIQIADTLWPVATGTYDEWTASSGTNLSCIDDGVTPDDDATYSSVTVGGAGKRITFTFTQLAPSGLIDAAGTNTTVDSVQIAYRSRWSGGGFIYPAMCLLRRYGSTDYISDTILAQSNTSYYERVSAQAGYTATEIDSSEWGIQVFTAPAAGKTYRITRIMLIVYYQRQIRVHTINSGLLDAYVSSYRVDHNYGGDTALYVGIINATSQLRRTLFQLDSSVTNDAIFPLYNIDTARLYIKTANVQGGTHNLYAFIGGTPDVYVGTAIDTEQTGSVSYAYSYYNSVQWLLPGADSAMDDGSADRMASYEDTAHVTTVSTWYSFDVRNWVAAAQSSYQSGTNYSRPLVIRQASEAVADSLVRFASENNATSANRPYLYIVSHLPYIAPLEGGPQGYTTDSIVLLGGLASLGEVWTMGMRKDSGVTTYDDRTLSYRNGYGSDVNYWGLRREWATAPNSTHWPIRSRAGDILIWRDAYRLLSYYGIGLRVSDTSYVDSVMEFVKVMAKSTTTVVQVRIRGPVLQRITPGIKLSWSTGASDSIMSIKDVRDSVFWKKELAASETATRLGASAADWDTVRGSGAPAAPDTSLWDVGYYSDSVIRSGDIPAAGSWMRLKRTAPFKAGMVARQRWELGGGAVDTIGYGDVFLWQDDGATADTFAVRVAQTRIWLGGVGGNTTCCGTANSPRLTIYLNQSKAFFASRSYVACKITSGAMDTVQFSKGGFRQNANWGGVRQRGDYGMSWR